MDCPSLRHRYSTAQKSFEAFLEHAGKWRWSTVLTEIAIIETLVKEGPASNLTPDRTPCSAGRLE
jgi:hypothetical protein